MVRSTLWNGRKHYGTISPWERHDQARCQSSNTTIASDERGAEPGPEGNVKTVAKWRKRETLEDGQTAPTEPSSTALSESEKAMVVAFRRHTLLPLYDCLYALQPSIPHLTRSALHRCLQLHGISRLPDTEGDKPKRQKFKRYPIGYFHVDIAELRTNKGKLYLFVAIDRTSKLAVAQLVDKANRKTAWECLETVLEAFHTRCTHSLRTTASSFVSNPVTGTPPIPGPCGLM